MTITKRIPLALGTLLLTASLTAQDNARVAAMQARIAKLEAANQELTARNAALTAKLQKIVKQEVEKSIAKAPKLPAEAQWRAAARAQFKPAPPNAARPKAAPRRAQAARPANRAAQIEVLRIREALEAARANRGFRGFNLTQKNPIQKGDFEKALRELRTLLRRLESAKEPDAAMKTVDETTQALLRARAALWKQKQAAKPKKEERR